MAQQMTMSAARAALEQLDYGEHGLTRTDLRARLPGLPDAIYLHLPDSKRYRDAREVLHEVATASARAEGEFMPADDDTPADGAAEDYGPALYGDSPLVSPTIVGPSGNTPLPGYDGNSLETEQEYSDE